MMFPHAKSMSDCVAMNCKRQRLAQDEKSPTELGSCVRGWASSCGFPSLPPCSYPYIVLSLFGVGITRKRSSQDLSVQGFASGAASWSSGKQHFLLVPDPVLPLIRGSVVFGFLAVGMHIIQLVLSYYVEH